MGCTGWAGQNDTINEVGDKNGWEDLSGNTYTSKTSHGFSSYKFGKKINNWGTWGQLIFSNEKTLSGQDFGNPTGLTGYMPPDCLCPGNSFWVQGHLINGECGGASGSNYGCNLTPISHNMNMKHKGCENTLQLLANRGTSNGSMFTNFNPNKLSNCWILYRTHAASPANLGYPKGLLVSLGIVIENKLITQSELENHFKNRTQNNKRWFSNAVYTNENMQKLLNLLGGVELVYP